METVILIRGLPASGKSSWIKKNRLETITVMRDAIRNRIYNGAWSQQIAYDVDVAEALEIRKLLHQYKVVIADGCHASWPRTQSVLIQATTGIRVRVRVLHFWILSPIVTTDEALRLQQFAKEAEASISRQQFRPVADRVQNLDAIRSMASEMARIQCPLPIISHATAVNLISRHQPYILPSL